MIIRKEIVKFIFVTTFAFFASFVFFSCQPNVTSGVSSGDVYVVAYNGEDRLMNTEELPLVIGPGVRGIDRDQTVFTIVNVGSDAGYTIWFDLVNFTKYSSSFGNIIEVSRADIENHLFSFNDRAVIRIGAVGVEAEETEEVIMYNARDLFVWQDVQGMRGDLTLDYVLKEDVVFPGNVIYTPVGTIDEPFRGTLYGDEGGKTIRGLRTRSTAGSYRGIFGVMYNGRGRDLVTVKDLILEDFNVSGTSHVGLVAGWMRKGRIQNVRAKENNRIQITGSIEIFGDSYGFGGGLVGLLGFFPGTEPTTPPTNPFDYGVLDDAFIESSSVEMSVPDQETSTNSNMIGGLVGYVGISARVQDSYTTGEVRSNGFYVGGLVGYSDGKGYFNYATGDVTGRDFVGGLYGRGVRVTSSYATGDVTGKNFVGGLVGVDSVDGIDTKSIVNTLITGYATGTVRGDNFVGGLVGRSEEEVVGYATGSVIATGSQAGGLVGGSMFEGVSITGYSRGTVEATNYAGGIYGAMVDENGVALPVTDVVIVGYSRSNVQRGGGNSTNFGKIAATTAVDIDASSAYHSTESNLLDNTGANISNSSTGMDGTEINLGTIAGNYTGSFGGFAFALDEKSWVWIADDSWPAIYLFRGPLSTQPIGPQPIGTE